MPSKTQKKRKRRASSSRKTVNKNSRLKTTAKMRATKGKKSKKKRNHERANSAALVAVERRGLGARAAGQSGDTQGLSGIAELDSESVEELMEEGQAYEAEVLDGVEKASDPDESEVFTREVPEDDVPGEYRGKS